jgi:hypothetical protein
MNPIILLATVVLLVGVDAKPANYERVKRQLPGVPREFQNINIENYLRVSEENLISYHTLSI